MFTLCLQLQGVGLQILQNQMIRELQAEYLDLWSVERIFLVLFLLRMLQMLCLSKWNKISQAVVSHSCSKVLSLQTQCFHQCYLPTAHLAHGRCAGRKDQGTFLPELFCIPGIRGKDPPAFLATVSLPCTHCMPKHKAAKRHAWSF